MTACTEDRDRLLVREADAHAVPAALLVMAGVIELPLFLAMLLLYLLQPVLKRLSSRSPPASARIFCSTRSTACSA